MDKRIQHQLRASQYVVLAVIVFAFLYATAQLASPFIHHDDLNLLVPQNWPYGYATPWYNTLAEGRWINYLWYHVSVSFTPRSAYFLFLLLYFIETCLLAEAARPNARSVILLGVALFFSPMSGELSLWPNGMTSVTILGVLATGFLLWSRPRFVPAILFLATTIIVVTYTPIAAMVLLVAAVKSAEWPLRQKIWLGVTYVCAFALGIAIIYALNYFIHGYFGVKIAAWRHPDPLRDWVTFSVNLKVCLGMWRDLLWQYWLPVTIGTLATLLALSGRETKNTTCAILLSAILVIGIQSGITIVSGVPVPTRSMGWVWIAICFICGNITSRMSGSVRAAAGLLLTILVIFGANAWWQLYRSKQPAAAFEAHLAAEIQQYQAITDAPEVIAVGNPRHVAGLRGLDEPSPIRALSMALWSTYRIKLVPCEEAFCTKAAEYALAQGQRMAPLFMLDDKLVLLFATRGKAISPEGSVRVDYPSRDEVAAMHLNYPPFLSYGSDSARITPFYPGSQRRPVSVRLAPNPHGYVLKAQGGSCGYAIDYMLVSARADDTLAQGEYAGTAPLHLSGWGDYVGDAILSVTMAPGASNNYGCNIVVTAQ